MITYKGKDYVSLYALAQSLGIPLQRLQDRLKKGWSLEKAIETPKISSGELRSNPVTYRGKHYSSRRKLCMELGVPESMVIERLSRGWSLEDAIETPKIQDRPIQSVEIDGVVYPSKQAAYDAYGIDKRVVTERVRNGMDLVEAIVTPYKRKRGTCTYDGKTFKSRSALADYLGVPRDVFFKFVQQEPSLDEACARARAYEKRTFFCIDGYDCTRQDVCLIRKRVNGDETELRAWLDRIFLEVPTEFHGRTFGGVSEACRELGGLDEDRVKSRMKQLLTFQQAVHELYFVKDAVVYLSRDEFRRALGLSRPVFDAAAKGLASRDAIVEAVSEVVSPLKTEASSLSIRKSNPEVSAVVNCRTGYYVVYCATCGRPLLLTEEEARVFKHSAEYCHEHTHEVLFKESVSPVALRDQLRLKGSYDEAMKVYQYTGIAPVSYRIGRRPDVEDSQLVCKGMFVLIHCKQCHRHVLLPVEDAKLFRHSDACVENEWLYCDRVDGRKIRGLSKDDSSDT